MMNRKIVDYGIYGSQCLGSLGETINNEIKKGYQPFGNLIATSRPDGIVCFSQAMVRYGEYADDSDKLSIRIGDGGITNLKNNFEKGQNSQCKVCGKWGLHFCLDIEVIANEKR